MNTLYVNLMGGPGTGKSTHCYGSTGLSKSRGFLAECIQEYAKDATYETEPVVALDQEILERPDNLKLSCQAYISGKQLWRQFRVMDKVQLVYTDTSLIYSGFVYNGFGCTESFFQTILEQWSLFNNLVVFLERTDHHPYKRRGRSQTEEEAQALDSKIKSLLDHLGVEYHKIPVESYFETCEKICDLSERVYLERQVSGTPKPNYLEDLEWIHRFKEEHKIR